MTSIVARRLVLRPIQDGDFAQWREVRRRNADWLEPWEPTKLATAPDPVEDRSAFNARCAARQRERQLGNAYGFGVFVDGYLRGEANLSNLVRGAFQNATIGYWIDREMAGRGYTPEAVVALFRFGFDTLHLHRIEINIIPRNDASIRVVDKLGIRHEGVSPRYLEIAGNWEDHARYAITAEEWVEREDAFVRDWL